MSTSIQEVLNTVNSNTSTTKTSDTSNTLGKDAFLQLLVTQMKYQDPLNPSTDAEYIAQLATFSQLEQLQNLNSTNTNAQALTLVGKTVTIKTSDSSNNEKYVSGVVDYVTMSNGEAKISVNDTLYSVSQIYEVYDDTYILSLGKPTVEESEVTYDHEDPSDIQIKVDLGTTSVATALAIIVNNQAIDSKYLSMKDNVVTIDKEAFNSLEEGSYDVIFSFNDPLGTLVNNKVTIHVTGEPEKDTSTEEEEGDTSVTEKE